ncbi:hypothetical protein ACROYT_G016120 [Oculina patagonica]
MPFQHFFRHICSYIKQTTWHTPGMIRMQAEMNEIKKQSTIQESMLFIIVVVVASLLQALGLAEEMLKLSVEETDGEQE